MRPGGTVKRHLAALGEKLCACPAQNVATCPYIQRGNNCRGVDHPETKRMLDALSSHDGVLWTYSDFMLVWDTSLKKSRNAYLNAKSRCENHNLACWPNYGGRGIKFLFKSLDQWLAEIGLPPSELHSVDRFPNNDGNYEPGNVRWATAKEQRANQHRAL